MRTIAPTAISDTYNIYIYSITMIYVSEISVGECVIMPRDVFRMWEVWGQVW